MCCVLMEFFSNIFRIENYDDTVADPGFPKGAPTYHFANFSRKLHENEEILGQRGARIPHAP